MIRKANSSLLIIKTRSKLNDCKYKFYFIEIFSKIVVVIKLGNNKIMGNSAAGLNQSFSMNENSLLGR